MGSLEQGVVRSISGETAVVMMIPRSPEHCVECDACEERVDGKHLEVRTTPGLEPGVRVEIEFSGEGSLGVAFVVFLAPVMAILVGVVLGSRVPVWLGRQDYSSTLFALGGAIVLLVLAGIGIRSYDRGFRRRGRGPRIARILR